MPLRATFVFGTSAVDAAGDMMKGHVTAPVIESDRLKIDAWKNIFTLAHGAPTHAQTMEMYSANRAAKGAANGAARA